MPPIRTRKSVARHFTPPIDLFHHSGEQVKTPQRCGVLYAKAFAQELGISIPTSIVRKITGVPRRIQSRILLEKEPRTLHNQIDKGPDPRGRKKALTRADTAAIAAYLSDSDVDLDDRGKPWLDIAKNAGVTLPETYHFKPPGYRTVNPKAVQQNCKYDEGIINAICEEERELTKDQAENRINWVDINLKERPHSKNWKDIAFCDEYHFGLGPQTTKRLKRKTGPIRLKNVHRKKVTSKDTKAKAREEKHLKLLNVFVAIGYNWRKVIPYKVPNNVGKMTKYTLKLYFHNSKICFKISHFARTLIQHIRAKQL